MKACTLVPKVGANLMKKLRQQYPYDVAAKVFLQATNPKFISDYSQTLKLDQEGIPTFESVMKNKYIKSIITQDEKLNSLNNLYEQVTDNQDNYNYQLQMAYNFNSTNDDRDKFTAIVVREDGKVGVKIVPTTKNAQETFKNQFATHKLNEKIEEIFSDLGITVGTLEEAEISAGRVGVTDFAKASEIAKGFSSIIRVANNMEGTFALSEEFSHLMIGTFRNENLIQRSLKQLQSNEQLLKEILGNDYQDVYDFYDGNTELIAEEALGHLLQEQLLKNIQSENIFQRTANYIRNKFKKYKYTDVEKALAEVNGFMNQFANEILSGKRNLTKEAIAKAQRDVRFNALSSSIERNVKILQKQLEVEAKRYKISTNEAQKEFANKWTNMFEYTLGKMHDEKEIELTLFKYCDDIISQLYDIKNIFDNIYTMSDSELFNALRAIKTTLASFTPFITSINQAMMEDSDSIDSIYTREHEDSRNEAVTIKSAIRQITSMTQEINAEYISKAMPAFCKFLKPFLGNDVVLSYGSNKGQRLTVEQLMTQADGDISMFDRWLDSMGQSSDILLQLFDKVVKQQKDAARNKTIDDIRTIVSLRQEAEKAGITDFEWMFEKDSEGKKSGRYIQEVNVAEFNRAFNEFEKSLDEKYGKNAIGKDAVAKNKEISDWFKRNTDPEDETSPNPRIYRNKDYDNLSSKQKEILEKFLDLKKEFDNLLPENKVHNIRAIQIRKSGAQRLIEAGSFQNILQNIKQSYEETFQDKIDDDQEFGPARNTLIDFEGHEYLTLPVLYTQLLEDQNDLSTDVFSTLMQYAYMANNFDAMNEVINQLETGRDLIKTERAVKETRGKLPVVENIKKGVSVWVNKSNTNIEAKLNDFFECQVYQRYIRDAGSFQGKISGKQYNINKIVNFVLKNASLSQLGFNFLANIANVATGSCMQNIESAGREYFSTKDLFKADGEYMSMIGPFIAELGSRFKQSKLALFDELINFKGNFKNDLRKSQKNNILQRIFGENIFFFGQDAGDHWLYNRTAIAMCKNKKVNVPGKGEVSLWDALEIVEDEKGFKKMRVIPGTKDENGKAFNMNQFSRQILNVNQTLFGVYNEEDSNAANRVIVGKLLQQYRKWIKPQFNKRFQAKQYNLTMQQEEEGYYRTFFRVTMNMAKELIRGKMQYTSMKDQLTEHEKANIRRAIFEIAQYFAVIAMVKFIPWDDDRHRPYAEKLAEYTANRLKHELGGLTPSMDMLQEMGKNVKNPIPAIAPIQDLINLIESSFTPSDYVETLQSGPYKGLTKWEKALIKTPLPGVRQYRQIDKFVNDLDSSIDYYARPY